MHALVLILLVAVPVLAAPEPPRSTLEARPDWSTLDPWQHTITRTEFEARLRTRYSADGAFLRHCTVTDTNLTVFTDTNRVTPLYVLSFGTNRPAAAAPATNVAQPLTICLDPGHLGGDWAQLEERSFRVGDDPPVREWDLNLRTAEHIGIGLERAGFRVVWAKREPAPVTPLRPEHFRPRALLALLDQPTTASTDPALLPPRAAAWSRLLFYRQAEIRARARIINDVLRPDLTLCIHWNAAGWGDSAQPRLGTLNQLVIFTHGAYLADELALEDMKYGLLRKLLERSSDREMHVAVAVGEGYARFMPGMPPADYSRWPSVLPTPLSPYVYSRNLLANRLYDGPVVFCEGPYMDAADMYARIQLGDYDGTRDIQGVPRRSLFREYADAVVDGVTRALAPRP
jgi:hypothetical protein